MSNTEGLYGILMVLLAVMVVILIALVIAYFVIKIKSSSKEKKQKKTVTSKDKTNKKTTPTSGANAYNKQSIFDFMEFDAIEDSMIVQKNWKKYIMVTECQGVNFDLMSQIEKVGVEEGFQQFLNTLRYPVQIYIQTRTVNLESSIADYKRRVREIETQYNKNQYEYNLMVQSGTYKKEDINKALYDLTKQRNLYEYARDLVENTERMSLNKNILNKKYYLVLSYMPEEASSETYGKEELRNMAFSELYTRSQALIRTLSACSVSGRIVNTKELIELLYVAYNRDDSEIYGLDKALKAEYDDIYTTAPDVYEKKIKILDERIRDEAINKANSAMDKIKTKSKAQQIAEEKEQQMDELIDQMAQMLLEENKQLVGTELAEQAIEEIKKEENNGKGGEIDESKKTTNRGSKKTI